MKFSGVLFAGLFLTLVTSCKPASSGVKVDVPDFNVDEITKQAMSSLKTCSKTDSETGADKIDPTTAIVVKDTIQTKEIIRVDCDKNEKSEGLGPVRELQQNIIVNAPVGLKEKINYATIENTSTCAIQQVDAVADHLVTNQEVEVVGQAPLKLKAQATTVGVSGQLNILLTDSDLKIIGYQLNVKESNNVLIIKYFGKCLKYRETVNEDLKDSYNCLEAEELSQKQVLLNVQIDRPVAEGRHLKNACYK